MKVAVLSDTHVPTRAGNLPGRVYEVCCEADLVLHCGDFVELDVYRDLQRFAPVRGVLGNMDGYDLRCILPETLAFTLEGTKVCMTHGSGPRTGLRERVKALFEPQEPGIILFGHSHRFTEFRESGLLMLNPGAVEGSRGNRSMALLTLEKGAEPLVEQVLF